MSEKSENIMNEMPYGFAASYEVTLYFENEPVIESDALVRKLEERLGETTCAGVVNDALTVALAQYPLADESGRNAEFAVSVSDIGPGQDDFNRYLSQSWSWPEAADLAGRVYYQVTLSDKIGMGLPYKERLVLFQVVLYCLVDHTRPMGIQWDASEQLIDPEVYLKNIPGDEDYDLLYGPLNVRMYSVKDTEDDTVMDTLGMAALGTVDIQCCFYGFDKEKMADLLFHYGTFVFWNGDVIKEGQTIEGIEPHEKWGIRHELSQLEPRRPIINIGPDIKL